MDVLIYSTTTCSFCHTLYSWLDNNKIKFKKILIDEDPAGMEEFMAVCDGVIGVPLTVITDKDNVKIKITGVDLRKFRSALSV
jgi:glutaredoxin 3